MRSCGVEETSKKVQQPGRQQPAAHDSDHNKQQGAVLLSVQQGRWCDISDSAERQQRCPQLAAVCCL
jgi:hypothetical protein